MYLLNDKPIGLIVHGKSVEELEKRISDYKNIDMYWVSMSTFDIPQDFILSKIKKTFNIVYDSSTVKNAEEYEMKVRIPRLVNYFTSSSGIYICTKSDKNNLYQLREKLLPEFNSTWKERILYVEDLGINPNPFCVSLHLFIACLAKMEAKKIVLFGADGGGDKGNFIESYYKHELIKEDKIIADNLSYNMVGDSNNINSTWSSLMIQSVGYIPTVYNCSPNSRYTVWPTISYDEAFNILKGGV